MLPRVLSFCGQCDARHAGALHDIFPLFQVVVWLCGSLLRAFSGSMEARGAVVHDSQLEIST